MRRNSLLCAAASAVAALLGPIALGADVSSPVTLQMFESTWKNTEWRAPDIFAAGYGAMWTPPPGRADSSNQSVGYDLYDRFDLGSAGNPTLYGTKTGLKTTIGELHKLGVNVYTDLIWNHNGFSNLGTNDGNGHTFANAGGYPGFVLTRSDDVDGDFHGAFETGDWNMRLAGLIDIAQEKNYQYIRSPVDPGDSRNLPAGTTPLFGRLANVPTAANKQFYPDQQLGGHTYFDPRTNQNYTLYDFNSADPTAGDPVTENATGYLMRQTRWMLQEIGVDGFRVDAAKNMPPWVLNYYDIATFKGSKRTFLDGSQQTPFAFAEVFDGNKALIQQYIRKDTNTQPPGNISGNRDALDFPLFFAMRDNLTSNGIANDWRNVKNASLDVQDDGLANNGSQGVAFVQSHDDFGPYLGNVAYAYALMRPGNAVVYFNAKEFGPNRPFPKDGRGDALGGLYGNAITKLVDIRNTHGRGNYADRTPAADAKEMLIYERQDSALVVLSNRLDGGFDSRTVQTSFAPGTPLLELTGNASDPTVDPNNDFPEVVVVNGDGTANLRVPRNKNANGVEHDRGYLIYGPSGPQGAMSLSNVAQTLSGGTATAATNGTTRLSAIKVITGSSFDVTLNTNKVNLLGTIRDHDADGDTALLSIDGALDVNGNGTVDFRTPGATNYGFDNFTTVNQPGYTSVDNNGTFGQTINATNFSEGYHYITARAFRHRNAGEPAIFRDFKQTIYVDRLKPVSDVVSFLPWDSSHPENRDVTIQSLDKTATQVQVLIDQPAAKTDAQILADVGTSNWQASQIDRDQFKFGFFNTASGNHVFTVVTREITGNYNIQRIAGINATGLGAGLGDLNHDGLYAPGDVTGTSYGMEALIYPNGAGQTNTQFNASADMNGDGLMDSRDLYLQRDRFVQINAPAGAIAAAKQAVLRRGDMNEDGQTNAADIDFLFTRFGNTAWRYDLDVDGYPTPSGADRQDVDVLVQTIFQTRYGDTDLSGRINFDDYVHTDNGFNNHLGGWANGDFDGNGRVDFDDYVILDLNFNQQSAGSSMLLRRVQDWMSGEGSLSPADAKLPGVALIREHLSEFGQDYARSFIAAVPEPTGPVFAGVLTSVSMLLSRRRRHRSARQVERVESRSHTTR
jgi:hypothetical protein